MIKLISIPTASKPDVQEIVLLCGKEYSVGRKQQDITLTKDASISRQHATVQVDHPMANVTNASLTPSLVITDLGSKFGTFMNDGIEANRPVSMREPNTLSHGDRFRFGLGPNVFRIHYTPLIATSSCLKTTTPLKKNLCALGGHLVPEWTDKCEFLVMDTLTLTVKVVCALLSAKHIVTPAYFEDYHEAVKSKTTKVPKPEDYMPALAETSLPKEVSFCPDPRRTQLFRGKAFLFVSTRQSKKIGVAVKCGGGTIDLITNVGHIALKSPDTIIVAPQDETIAAGPCANAVETYENANKRLIQESEIGLAAVYKNIDKNCNPFFSLKKSTLPPMTSQTQRMPSGGDGFTTVEDSEPPSQQPVQRLTQSQSDISMVDESVTESMPSVLKRPNLQEIDGATKVKREKDGGNEADDDVETSVCTEKSGLSREDAASASSSKRRLDAADVRRAEPTSKKLRQTTSSSFTSPNPTQRSTRSSSAKALSSVFSMIDSDDDETEAPPEVVVPDSQISSQRVTRSQTMKSPEKLVIPDSQATPPRERSPNKRSSPTKQTGKPQSYEKDQPPNAVDRSDTSFDTTVGTATDLHQKALEEEVASRNKRKRAEANDSAIMPAPPTPAKKIKRTLSDLERTPTTSRNQGIWDETSIFNKQAIKGTAIGAQAVSTNASQEILKPMLVAFKSLLVKRNITPQLEKAGDKAVKNFKVFKKVTPLTPVNTSFVMNNSDRTSNTKRTTGSTRSTITLRRHVAAPAEPLVVEIRQRAAAPEDDVPDFSFD